MATQKAGYITCMKIRKGYLYYAEMSQYGADAMARQGSSYAEILAHYYPGTDLSRQGRQPLC